MKAIIKNINITSISSYLPETVFELSSLSKEFGEKVVANIIRATGIERIRIADKDETSSDMCFKAAEYLLRNECVERKDVDGLVFVSQTSDYLVPSTSVILQDRLGLSKDTVCIDIHYGCSGYIYGLFQACLWINSGACTNVLVLSGDTSTKMINPKDKSLRMVFGDCGTATLLKKGADDIGFNINSDGGGYDRLIIPAGGFRIRSSDVTKILEFDEDGNGRTQEDLYMDGMAIFDFSISNVHKNIDSLIEFVNWDKESINLFVLHQANKFMINTIRKKMKVEETRVPMNLTNYGNTGPATIPLLLSDLYSSNSNVLDRVILSGFGVGLSWGSIACNLTKTKLYKPINK
ncbi:MAG: ketoacyl-ACP synthase III [Acholeplasma sp.]|nr:ketoacyl-ACP synthase III [Acholeplasma sp.]